MSSTIVYGCGQYCAATICFSVSGFLLFVLSLPQHSLCISKLLCFFTKLESALEDNRGWREEAGVYSNFSYHVPFLKESVAQRSKQMYLSDFPFSKTRGSIILKICTSVFKIQLGSFKQTKNKWGWCFVTISAAVFSIVGGACDSKYAILLQNFKEKDCPWSGTMTNKTKKGNPYKFKSVKTNSHVGKVMTGIKPAVSKIKNMAMFHKKK